MIRVVQVMDRIRLTCPGFASVDNALTSAATLDYPAALVTPLKVDASQARFTSYHIQKSVQTFGVYLILRREQDDPTGPSVEFDDLCAQMRAGLPFWTPDPTLYSPMNFAGGQLDRYRDGIVCWRDDYTIESEIRIIP